MDVRSFWSLLFGLLMYVSYLCLGAVIFMQIENRYGAGAGAKVADSDRRHKHLHRLHTQYFLDRHDCITESELDRFIAELLDGSSKGVSVKNSSTDPNWTFGQSLFFSGTIVTTIGYGHVTPLSRAGKAFCIIYAIFGIPFTLVLLSAFVERLLGPVMRFLEYLNVRLGHLYQPFKIRILHLLIIVTAVILLFLAIPAGVFTYLEPEWNYLDSFYYCFISLTTIGLGDYIPGDAPNQPFRTLYKVLTTVYLIIGITFIMTTLAVFYDIPQLNVGLLFSASGDADAERVHLVRSQLYKRYSDADPKIGHPIVEEPTIRTEHTRVFRVRSRQPDDSSPDEP